MGHAPPYCDVLFIEKNNKIQYNFINTFFPAFVISQRSACNGFLPFQNFLKRISWLNIVNFENSKTVKIFQLGIMYFNLHYY